MLIGRASAWLSRQKASLAASRSGTSPRDPSSSTPPRSAASAATCSRCGLLGAQVGHAQHREVALAQAELLAHLLAPAADGDVRVEHPVGHHHDPLAAVAAALERLDLALADGDHPVDERRDQPGQRLLVRAQPQQLAVGRERRVLVEDVGGAGAAGDRLAEQLRAHASGHHGARAAAGLAERAPQGRGVGAPAQVQAGDRHPGRSHLLEQRALAVEADQARLGSAPRQRRDQRGPLALGAAALHVGREEEEPHRARRWVASTSPARAAGRWGRSARKPAASASASSSR